MNARAMWIVIVVLMLGSFAGCKNRKDLNTGSAKDMLQERLDKESTRSTWNVDQLSKELPKMSTLVDYRTIDKSGSDLPAQVHRLIDGGFVTVQQSSKDYPDVSGKYHADVRSNGFIQFSYDVELLMHAGSTDITGQWSWSTPNGASHMSGTVQGSARPDGQINFTYLYPPGTSLGASRGPYIFRIDDSNGQEKLVGPDLQYYGVTDEFLKSGHPNADRISVPMYSYSFSPKASALVKVVNGADVVDAGRIVVDSVDNLLLATDTVATGNFKWHRDFTEIARALSGTNHQEGSGQVQFGKEPDGTWTITILGI